MEQVPDSLGFPVVKNLPANAGDVDLIPRLGRSPGEGNGNPLHYSCLENPMDPCFLWKGFPAFLVHLRMRPVSGGNSRLVMCEYTLCSHRQHSAACSPSLWFLQYSCLENSTDAEAW